MSPVDVILERSFFCFLHNNGLCSAREPSNQVADKNFGIKVLKDSADRFTGPVFKLQAAFELFVLFFDRPALVIEFLEVGSRESDAIQETGHQNFNRAIGEIDPDQT